MPSGTPRRRAPPRARAAPARRGRRSRRPAARARTERASPWATSVPSRASIAARAGIVVSREPLAGPQAGEDQLRAPGDPRRAVRAVLDRRARAGRRPSRRSASANVTPRSTLPPSPTRGDGAVDFGVTFATRIFGEIPSRLALTVEDRPDGTPGIAWRPEQVFPGPARGRAARARDHDAAAARRSRRATARSSPSGEARLSELGPLASEIAGRSARRRPSARRSWRAAASPRATPVGLTGLERTFDERLAGMPGGTLKAGGRVLARSEPVAGIRGPDHDRPGGPGGGGDRARPAASAGSR